MYSHICDYQYANYILKFICVERHIATISFCNLFVDNIAVCVCRNANRWQNQAVAAQAEAGNCKLSFM